jgi:hypothetical protein
MSEPTAPLQEYPHDEPVETEKVTGASESRIAGLTTLPDKRPSRRFFGLLPGRRSA